MATVFHRVFLISILVSALSFFLSLHSFAQIRPDTQTATQVRPNLPKKPPTNTTEPVMLELSNHCPTGPANWNTAPRWSDVEAQNRGYFDPRGSDPAQTGDNVVGVPDLDNPLGPDGYFDLGTGLMNITSFVSHYVSNFDIGDRITASVDKKGTGLCLVQETVGLDTITVLQNATMCDYRNACEEDDRIFWVPGDMDFLHKLETPNGDDLKVAPDGGTYQIELDGFVDESKKWSAHVLDALNILFNSDLPAEGDKIVEQEVETETAGRLETKVGKFTENWQNFENNTNRMVEGYHFGAYDTMRPDLHQCVGYFGHSSASEFANLFGGKIDLGSYYTSHTVSEKIRSQVRLGGMMLELNRDGKPPSRLALLATPEINLQLPTLSAGNCDAPFGIGVNMCLVTNVSGPPTCKAPQYLSAANLNPDDPEDFIFAPFVDYYPVSLDGDTHSRWPRTVTSPPSISPISGITLKGEIQPVTADDYNMGVLSIGMNYGTDFTLPKPTPRDLGDSFLVGPAGPALGQFRWDLSYGIEWFHDSNRLMEEIKNSLDSIDVNAVTTRDMHAMQADDLTADNGHGFYTEPSLYLALGYMDAGDSYKLNLSLDLGLFVDLMPSFYGGIADMNYALKSALEDVNANDGLECNPVYAEEMKTVSGYCTADNYISQNQPLADGIYAVSVPEPLNSNEVFYVCDGSLSEDQLSFYTPSEDMDSDDILETNIYECETRGYCHFDGGDVVHNTKSNQCSAEEGGTFYGYECKLNQKTEIVGWEGPGCSPLLSGFPESEGGLCTPAGGCDNGLTCNAGACTASCSISSDCSGDLTCDTVTNSCVPLGGIQFAEQIEWAALNPGPTQPKHSVWSHTANKLETKVDLSLGLSVNLQVDVMGNRVTVLDEVTSEYWNILNAGKFYYDMGLSADYDNSCSASVGDLTTYQPANLTRVLGDTNISSGMSSEAFINSCMSGLPSTVTDDDNMPDPVSPEAVADDAVTAFQFSEDLGLEMWEEHAESICINGQNYNDFMGGLIDGNGSFDPTSLPVDINGVATPIDQVGETLITQSGCLAASNVSSSNPLMAGLAATIGTDAQGNLDIMSHRVDSNGPLTLDNINPAIRNHPGFVSWWSSTSSCAVSYATAQNLSFSSLETEPCDDEDGTIVPIDVDNPGPAANPCPPGTMPVSTSGTGPGGAAIACTPVSSNSTLIPNSITRDRVPARKKDRLRDEKKNSRSRRKTR